MRFSFSVHNSNTTISKDHSDYRLNMDKMTELYII